MARPKSNNNGRAPMPVVDKAQIEVSKQALEQLQTLSAIKSINTEMLKMLGRIHTQLDQVSDNGVGAVPFFGGGGGVGGGYAPGPNGGRPIMPGNQTRRPGVGPGGIYPGGHGYGMQGTNFGYGGNLGGVGGVFGAAQAGAARFAHNRFGLGSSPGGAPAAMHYQRQADGSYSSFDHEGNLVENGISQATYARRAAVSTAAARAAASGGPIGAIRGAISGLPMAGKVAGAALVGAEAAQKFGTFVGNQRQANAQYESIYGPGTSGFDQRLHNLGGRFRNTLSNIGSGIGLGQGGLTDGDYDKVFKQTSAMGFRGADRNNMIGFATSNFNGLGMSADESLKLIGINAKEAASSFSELHNQLKRVSEQAQQTGQSAEVFRQSFTQSYGAAVGAGYAGSSAIIAGAQVASTAGQGRLFTGLNTSAMYGSVGAQQVLANREGFNSVLDFSLATQANPQVLAQAQQKQLNQVFEAVVPPQVRAAIEAAIKKHGGAQNVATNQNAAQSVVSDVERANPGSMNSIAILQAMRTAGIAGAENLDSVAAAIYYVQWVAKSGKNFTDPTAKGIAARQQQVGSTTAKRGEATRQIAPLGIGKGNIAFTTSGGQKASIMGHDMVIGGKSVYDPVIAKMQAAKISRVQVQTANGQQLVSLDEASKNYRDQLVKGTAIIASGPNMGQTVGTIFGTEQNAKDKDTTGSKASKHGVFSSSVQKQINSLGLTDAQVDQLAALRGAKLGGDRLLGDKDLIKDAQKMAGQNSGGGGGTITVGLKPEVAKYLDIATTGDSLVNKAASSGAPPSLDSSGSSTGH